MFDVGCRMFTPAWLTGLKKRLRARGGTTTLRLRYLHDFMKSPRMLPVLFLSILLLAHPSPAQPPTNDSPATVFAGALTRLSALVAPSSNQPPKTFTTTVRLLKAGSLPKQMADARIDVALQAPDHLRVSAAWARQGYSLCRDGEELWIFEPAKQFGLIGRPGISLFSADPTRRDDSTLGPIKLPLGPEQLVVLPFLYDLKMLHDEEIQGAPCHVLIAQPKSEATRVFHIPPGTLQLWIRESDSLPLRVDWNDGKGVEFEVELENPQLREAWPEENWKLRAPSNANVQPVPRTHLTRFLSVALRMLNEKPPTLGTAVGARQVIARCGQGRLEDFDGTRVLFLKGTPEEMGRQQGTLLRREVRDLVDHILYGVGVGSSFEKGRWFFGEIESAQARVAPFIDQRCFREMDALADAAGLQRQEVRLANFFPELFHCSGFALFGKATVGGRLYHGRILDYLRGLGLEQNAVVVVNQPDEGNAWVNVSYAGFIGSVTAMNEKQIAMGEMGGRGEGRWDGKPMAELVREVMEKADTLDQAIDIMRKGPRTCEYYYVISDAKSKRAVGIAATPDTFETIWPGQAHPRLPHAIEDAVLMSAGDRYEELVRRVQDHYGKIDAQCARDLMKRPVCMTSNIHCALFAPDTLDFWVANADSKNPAAHTRFTHYNLAELLQSEAKPQ